MKIYNEIILEWNEITQQYDTIYEDSFDYNGMVDYALDDNDPPPLPNVPQNTDEDYAEIWHNENIEQYRQAVASKIAQLLLEKLSEIENATGEDLLALQKTFRGGRLKTGIL